MHVEGAERIAEAVAKYDVDRFVHVSSYNADPNSKSDFYRTKGRGEQAVRSIFPEATIVRPAPMFGWEDKLLNKFGGLQTVFTSNRLQQTCWPVHVSHAPSHTRAPPLPPSDSGLIRPRRPSTSAPRSRS